MNLGHRIEFSLITLTLKKNPKLLGRGHLSDLYFAVTYAFLLPVFSGFNNSLQQNCSESRVRIQVNFFLFLSQFLSPSLLPGLPLVLCMKVVCFFSDTPANRLNHLGACLCVNKFGCAWFKV